MLGVHPVLVALVGQVVVDGLGKDLGPPAGPAQDVAQQNGVGARGVPRVQRRDELVHGDR